MISVADLCKYYGGKRALGPVSFSIENSETVGFLGLNGAGKTTALRILACDLRPSAGSVVVGGFDAVADPHSVRRLVGFLPEIPPLYQEMTVADYLSFAGRIHGMSAKEIKARLPEVLAVTHTEEVRGELIRNLSHGYRQRVGVAQAIVHRPRLLILDEPTRGLDPVQVVDMRGMIRDLKKDHTILISSHILTEISETCDRLLVLGDGAIVASGSEAQLATEMTSSRRYLVSARPAATSTATSTDGSTDGSTDDSAGKSALFECLRAVPRVTVVRETAATEGAPTFEVEADDDIRPDLCRSLVAAGHDVLRIDRASCKLETVFLELVKGGDSARN
ncbi:MAG: ABC transporter ATP-binding protein [Pseudomonadota bacterium]